jgi:hypothetical protein
MATNRRRGGVRKKVMSAGVNREIRAKLKKIRSKKHPEPDIHDLRVGSSKKKGNWPGAKEVRIHN